MQGTATKLLTKFDQGPFTYYKPGATSGPAYDPVYEPETEHTVSGSAQGVEERYIKDGYISGSDIQLTASVFDVTPTIDGEILIQGKRRQIIEVQQIPAAGTPVAWRIFVKS
jgi:hypothetical protein